MGGSLSRWTFFDKSQGGLAGGGAVLPGRQPLKGCGNVLGAPACGGENAAMPRTARASVGGYCYHALNRGNGRARIFHDADDYHRFVRLLHKACARVPMRLLGYCWMPNHFHLVLWPHGDNDLGRWMQ
jgi:hypothetical protein